MLHDEIIHIASLDVAKDYINYVIMHIGICNIFVQISEAHTQCFILII